MIITPTTLVVGAGAGTELSLPSSEELLVKIGQGFDFARLGTATQSRDTALLAQYMGKLAERAGIPDEEVKRAAGRLHTAAKFARSIDGLLEQHDTDPLVAACGKVAIVHFLCQAEAKSILRLTPRAVGDLPIQGTETWLFQLGQLVTSGVPRSQVERCLDRLSIVSFCYDRSVEHFLPHALHMAFGMALEEAQGLVAARLRIVHPYGTIGRLPWQPAAQVDGDAEAEWGTEYPANIHNLAAGLRSPGEALRDTALLDWTRATIGAAHRLAFLGFGFQSQNLRMLLGEGASVPEVLATGWGLSPISTAALARILLARCGLAEAGALQIAAQRAHELMRDYALLLES